MTRSFPVKPAEDLLDAEFMAKWRDRQTIGAAARTVLETILGRFVELGGPVPIEALTPKLADRDPAGIADALRELNEKDLIVLRDGLVVLAYPFAGGPTPFSVVLPDGRARYAVCAVDALGIPPMLDQPATIHSRCHHCGDPLRLEVGPTGPVGASEAMVWVGERSLLQEKACDSLWRTINFFRSEEHLADWWRGNPGAPGAAAVLSEAFALSRKIFGELLPDLLRPAAAPPAASSGVPS